MARMRLRVCNPHIGGLVALVVALCSVTASTQPAQKPVVSDAVFKNVQLLKGIPVSEFMDTMGFFSASIGSNCVHCHVEDSLTHWEKFAEDVPRKQTARRMIRMVDAINKTNFGGRKVLTCYSCHRGDLRPEAVPSLLVQYSLPVEDPNRVEIVPNAPAGLSATEILDKYIDAIGGAQRVARLRSFVGKGTYQAFDTYDQKVPFEVFANAPNQRATVVHTQNGDSVATFDGQSGWIAGVDKPVTLLPLIAGGELDGAKFDAELSLPVRVKQALTNWRVGFPPTAIDDKEAQVIQGTGAGGTRMKLYFARETGLLMRVVRYTNTLVGAVPTQIDYSDYREVAGVKLPFKWTVTWTTGQSMIELADVQPNVTIDPKRFAQPAPAVVKSAVRSQ